MGRVLRQFQSSGTSPAVRASPHPSSRRPLHLSLTTATTTKTTAEGPAEVKSAAAASTQPHPHSVGTRICGKKQRRRLRPSTGRQLPRYKRTTGHSVQGCGRHDTREGPAADPQSFQRLRALHNHHLPPSHPLRWHPSPFITRLTPHTPSHIAHTHSTHTPHPPISELYIDCFFNWTMTISV
ncbi:hypothetical protein GBAR_LOCUS31580 [Geodia barretti]|uniref:Uncharacterized protein n=1 Tax=Geodia barretti TaxID=519541 RepID=A0AA35XN96_GEOBA|nr:hypothetical protein GBAR_LOCUS31580 [Geodia barretti]